MYLMLAGLHNLWDQWYLIKINNHITNFAFEAKIGPSTSTLAKL